jgi:group I intron endonuclease
MKNLKNDIKIGIYKITSPSGKIYIGQSINIKDREKDYYLKRCKKQPKIFYSIQKYGWKNHKFEIIEECSIDMLNKREAFYKQQVIDEHGWKKALFCEIYDNSTGPKSEETKLKISKGNKGKIVSKETRNKISKANKGVSRNKGHQHSNEVKNKISISKKGQPVDKLKVKVLQYGLYGNFIKCWLSVDEASRKTGINQSDISSCCLKRIKSAGNYQWIYYKESIPESISPRIYKDKKRIVCQFDLQGNLIKEWPSIKEATQYIKANSGEICACCKGKQKTVKGYKWSYKNVS